MLTDYATPPEPVADIEEVDAVCTTCEADVTAEVRGWDGTDTVEARCPLCGDALYVRVVFDPWET